MLVVREWAEKEKSASPFTPPPPPLCQVVGRLASAIARVLMGKDKPTYTPHDEHGDVVVVVNARHVHFSGNKVEDKARRPVPV